jgi:hypothetical protein
MLTPYDAAMVLRLSFLPLLLDLGLAVGEEFLYDLALVALCGDLDGDALCFKY